MIQAIQWFKLNRLKFFSGCAVAGDLLTGMGGVSTLWGSAASHAGLWLMGGSALALCGHGVLFLWGRGARDSKIIHTDTRLDPIVIRPFLPWRYPLDTGFLTFGVSGLCYALWGVIVGNIPMVLVGLLLASASFLAWLYPQEKTIFGFRPVQITAAMYITASVNTLIAGIVADNLYIIASSCIYAAGNAILFTTRKENQSTYTQSHG